MDLIQELENKLTELNAVRASILKLLSNGGVQSYGVAGSNATYRNLPELRQQEKILFSQIKELEDLMQGKSSSMIKPAFRI